MNKTGKGGFKDHPENINKNGTGRGALKGTTIIDYMRIILNGDEDTIPDNPRKELAKILIKKAKDEDKIDALKTIIQYDHGMPKQALELTGADGEDLYPKCIEVIFGSNTGKDNKKD